jgi:hypothetical protein
LTAHARLPKRRSNAPFAQSLPRPLDTDQVGRDEYVMA